MSSEDQAIQNALKSIETNLIARQEARLSEIKAGKNVADLDPKIKALEAEHAQLKADLEGLAVKLGRDFGATAGLAIGQKSSGAAFVDSAEFKGRSSGRFSVTLEQKALTSASSSLGAALQAERLPFVETPTREHIRDLLPVGETSASVLKFPQRKSLTMNAATVAEGAAKPQSDFTFEMVTTEVKKIAHYLKASDEILDDMPALRSYIDAQLIEGLRDAEDAQILKGDGTGQNLTGLYTVASEFNRSKGGDTLLDTLLRAKTQLRLANRTATAVVMNPEDWEAVQLLKGSDSHYIWANVLSGNEMRVWALPVRDTTTLSKGEWLMGDFKRGAQLFDRMQASITVANQNEDDFIKNMVTILAEERLALVIYDRLAFVRNAS